MGSTSTEQSKLLLVDTCVVIHACTLGVWDTLTSRLRIAIPEITVGEAIQTLRADKFDDLSVNLDRDVSQGKIAPLDVPASDLRIVHQLSGPKFRGAWDDGELVCMACLLHEKYGCSRLCSSDAVVFRFLGWTRQDEKGISLEEILESFGGPRRRLLDRLTRRYREQWTKQGFGEAWQSGVIKP